MAFISMLFVSGLLVLLLIMAIFGLLLLAVAIICFFVVGRKEKKVTGMKRKAHYIPSIVTGSLGMLLLILPVGMYIFGATKSHVPEKVTMDGVTYRNGFYSDDLWPQNLSYAGESVKVGRYEFYHVEYEQFDWVHSSFMGGKANGMIYCKDSQWKEAHDYYSDNSNFEFRCKAGNNQNYEVTSVIDISKFDRLLRFADENSSKSFGAGKGVETVRLPFPGHNDASKIKFYKRSTDGFFTSYQGHEFQLVDDRLRLVLYYDYHRGEKEKELVAVDVPDELNQYFVEFLAELTMEE